jgi:hypothetical protein
MQTRQTKNIFDRLPGMVQEIIRRIRHEANIQERRLSAYRNENLGSSQMGDALLVDLFRRNVLNGTQFHRALQEWVEPTFIEHQADGDYTVWNLFNSVTQSLKPEADLDDERVFNHSGLQQRTQRLTAALDSHLGLDFAEAA